MSFLHLDLRFINMIYNNGHIYLVDAENCEFGDPLFDLAVIDINDTMTESFLAGYTNSSGCRPNIDSDLFLYYKLERLALIVHVFMNEVKDHGLARLYLAKFRSCVHSLRCRIGEEIFCQSRRL